MNPFQINTSYNKELNSLLAKITKKSSTTKLKALKTLKDNLTTLDIENNMNDVLKVLVPLLDNETEIKAIATDLLYRISTIYKNNQFVEPIIPKLILLAIEENNKSFLKVYNVNVYFDVLVNMISYENNLIVYYKILVYALKCNLMKQEIQNILVRDAHLYNYRSTIELKYISVILSYNKENVLVKDAFIEHIKSIRTSNCISIKWQILSVIYKYFDNQMLIDDSKFIDIETLKVIENDKITWECYKPKNIEVFLYVYAKVEDKNKFLFKYIADQRRSSENLKFNILDLCKDFSILNESIEFEQMNVILKYITDNDLWTIDKKNALKGLTEEQKIERAYIIGYTLDYQPDIKIADANINMAVHVLPVQYFADNIDKFKNQHEIFKKYPGLITLEYIKTIIYVKEKLCEYLPAITDSKVQEYIKNYMTKYYKTEDYIYICDRISIPDYLQLLFCFNLYNIKEIEINTIEAKTIINEYFNIDFVIYLLQNGKLNLNNFIYDLYVILGKLEINNSIAYNHEFYYINSFFYQNIQYTPFDTQTSEYLLFIKETLEKIQSIKPGNNSLIFLIMITNEILGIEQKDMEIEMTERVKNNLLASQSAFGIKVLFDLERRFLITLDDINEILIGFDTFDCEYLDYKLGNEVNDEIVKCYHNLRKKDQITQKDISECLSLKNARLNNFLIEKLPFDRYKDDVQIVFSREQSLETQMNSITLETKSCIYLEDTNYLSITALKNVFQYCDDYRNYMPILNALRNDYAWDCSCYKSKERRDVLNELLEPIYQQISLEFIDIYSLTRFEENADGNEIFALMTSNINFSNLLKSHPLFAWNVFLRSLHLLRNINIIFFIEKMIKSYDFDTIDDELQTIYNFNFPNIGTNKQSLAKLIEHELNHKINNMTVTLLKKATGYILKASYIYEESTFECKLELDNINIKKTTFETTVFQKDLLTIKIRSLLQKCHKYMEILCIWKINIDNKMQGMKECLICYLTVDENMFPDYECKTCANKFHKKCLSKWADKSANFTCPLCRGKFR